MQKLVRGATKPKSTAPKAKYIEPILATTYEAGHDFETVMDSLSRIITSRNQAWPSIYKGLIVVHIMIREGSEDVTLKFVSRHTRMFEIEDYVHRAPAMERYARYLSAKGHEYREHKIDYVRYKTRQGNSRLQKLSVEEGLLRECKSVIIQLDVLTKCQYQEQDIVSDDVLLMAFRLLVHDALSLFQVLNEGVINLLEHFFELSHHDAEQALDIYRAFRSITSRVISYLRIAKDFEFKTMLHIPNIKHAPTSLVSSLESYVNDPEFEANRRQYLEEKQAHNLKRSRSKKDSSGPKLLTQTQPAQIKATTQPPIQSQNQNLNQNQNQNQNPSQSQSQVQIQTQTQTQAQPQPQIQPVQPQPQVAVQGSLQQTLMPGGIQMVSPELNTNANTNPFWQVQAEASNIQAADSQAQLQMQQLHQLQLQQQQQQELVRQQLQQLQQQQAQVQAQQAQQAQQAPVSYTHLTLPTN